MNELPKKEWLLPIEVAGYLSVSRQTVYNWIRLKVLDSSKIRGVVRISKESLKKKLEK